MYRKTFSRSTLLINQTGINRRCHCVAKATYYYVWLGPFSFVQPLAVAPQTHFSITHGLSIIRILLQHSLSTTDRWLPFGTICLLM